MNIFKSLVIVVASCLLVACASVGFRVEPDRGNYEMVFRAEDCINSNNIVGSVVNSIPVVGEWVTANFGC